MKKILIAEFKHETNTFIDKKTSIDCFQAKNLLFGEEIISYFKNVKNEIGGFISVLQKLNDIEIVPAFAANAMPSGIVKDEVLLLIRDRLLQKCHEHHDLDGILISFHGAMVSESSGDCEGDILEAVREVAGNTIPIFITLDFHANITKKMIGNATAMFPFDNYPHTDMYERGMEAAQKLYDTIHGKIKPVLCVRKLPILYPFIETSKYPHKLFLDKALEYEKDSRVISVSVVSGFAYADISEAGVSIIAQTDGNGELAQEIVRNLGDLVFDSRHMLQKTIMDVSTSVKTAIEHNGTVVLADVSDNPGCGCPGDATILIQELINKNIQKCYVATVYDPETVKQAVKAGPGSKIHVCLGGKTTPIAGKPIDAEAYVKCLSDGVFTNKGVMAQGVVNHIGLTAVLQIAGVIILVASQRHQPWDSEVFRFVGLTPEDAKVIVLKSSVHFRRDFSKFTDLIIEVDAPNICPQDFSKMSFKHVRRPIFPLDEIEILHE